MERKLKSKTQPDTHRKTPRIAQKKTFIILGIFALGIMSMAILAWSILLPRVLVPRALTRIENTIGRAIQGTAQIRGVNYSPMEGITIREIRIDSPLIQGGFFDLQAQPNLGFLLGFSETPVDLATLGYINLRFDGAEFQRRLGSSGSAIKDGIDNQQESESKSESEPRPEQETPSVEPPQAPTSGQIELSEGIEVNPILEPNQNALLERIQQANQLLIQIFPRTPRQFRISSGDLEWWYLDERLVAELDYGLWTRDASTWSAHGILKSQLGTLVLSGSSGEDLGLTTGSLGLTGLDLVSLPPWLPLPPGLGLIPQGMVDGKIELSSGDTGIFRFNGSLALTDGILDWNVFSSEPVLIPPLRYEFMGSIDLISQIPPPVLVPTPDPPRYGPAGILEVESGNLSLGSLQGQFTPRVLGFLSRPLRITFDLNLPPTPLQQIFEAAPEVLRRGFSGMEIEGTFGWDFFLELPMDRLGHMQWSSQPQLEDLHFRAFPERFSPFDLNQGFPFRFSTTPDSPNYLVMIEPRRAIDFDFVSTLSEQTPLRMQRRVEQLQTQLLVPDLMLGPPNPRKLPVGMGSRDILGTTSSQQYWGSELQYSPLRFVPLQDMSPYLIKAVLTGEDGDFFFHPGFNWNTLRSAIERNLRSGQVQFGASTISMQLVKNLLLDDSRELVRKLQEAFLVYLMEHRAGIFKDRILELYLNIASFGPTSPGIHGGAQHFFQKHPKDLNLLESVWLATMLPSPYRFSGFIVDGAPAPFWLPRMQFFLDVMLERGRISEEDHSQSNPANLRFRPSFDPSVLPEPIDDDELQSTNLDQLLNELYEADPIDDEDPANEAD